MPEEIDEAGWVRKCTNVFLQCVNDPDLGAAEWGERRRALDQEAARAERFRKVSLHEVDLTGKSLQSYDFRFCYLVKIVFTNADLSHARFDKSVLDTCNFTGADVADANFEAAAIKNSNLEWKHSNIPPNLNVRYLDTTTNIMRPYLLDEVNRQRSIADRKNMPANMFMRIWNWLTDYGTRINRLAFISITTVAVFGIIFYILHRYYPGIVDLSGHDGSIYDFVIYSAERFMNASSEISVVSPGLRVVQAVETLLGILALAIFTAWLVGVLLKNGK